MAGSGDRRLLKILHIDPEKNWGGEEAQVLGLLTYLAAMGHRNDLVAHPSGFLSSRRRHWRKPAASSRNSVANPPAHNGTELGIACCMWV